VNSVPNFCGCTVPVRRHWVGLTAARPRASCGDLMTVALNRSRAYDIRQPADRQLSCFNSYWISHQSLSAHFASVLLCFSRRADLHIFCSHPTPLHFVSMRFFCLHLALPTFVFFLFCLVHPQPSYAQNVVVQRSTSTLCQTTAAPTVSLMLNASYSTSCGMVCTLSFTPLLAAPQAIPPLLHRHRCLATAAS
jgi:hypothetical protein